MGLLLVSSVVGAGVLGASQGPATTDNDDGDDEGTNWDEVPGVNAPDTGDGGAESPEPEANTPLRLRTANSSEAFRSYVYRARRMTDAHGGPRVVDDVVRRRVTPTAETGGPDLAVGVGAQVAAGGDGGGGARSYEGRVGRTNVQVTGVDEPDVVKAVNGTFYVQRPADQFDSAATAIVDATPPEQAGLAGDINESGRMLVGEERVVMLPPNRDGPVEPMVRGVPDPDDPRNMNRTLVGYDTTTATEPEQTWERDLQGRIVSARLLDGQVVLVVANRLPTTDGPCEVRPMASDAIDCTEIRHPGRPVPVEVTYSVLTVDAGTGETRDRTSFVGSQDATVYVSPDAVYTSYTTRQNEGALRTAFLLESDVVPERVKERLRTVQGYDLTPRAERIEVRATVRGWLDSLDAEARERTQEELRTAWEAYLSDRRRNLTTTHLVRFPLSDLNDSTTGTVPGQVLNQFSFDVHDGHLRVATTVGERFSVESANDVYVLDAESLERTGSVTGMSEGQRVYGVRFVDDRGYVVTFRRVDPLHVLDLSDPAAPTEEGSVKLPGFSSYLHPLEGDRVMGIGEEDGKVKAVIFDVSDPTEPRVAQSRVLDARWSAVSRTHHAFTYDARHNAAFLPTPSGGYVLSTEDLSTETRVEMQDPRRARYVGDHLFMFGQDSVTVLNETDWSTTTTVGLAD